MEKYKEVDILNAKRSSRIIAVVSGEARKFDYIIMNCLGEETKKEAIELSEGTYTFDVPPSGLISFRATN